MTTRTQASFTEILDALQVHQYFKDSTTGWGPQSIQFYKTRDGELMCTAGLGESWKCFGRQLEDLKNDTFTQYELFAHFYSREPLAF